MKRKPPLTVKARRIFSRCGPFLLVCQRAPIAPLIAHEARTLGISGFSQVAKWSVAVVSGLGAFDSVSGATVVKQIAPVAGSSSVPATNGRVLSFIVQVTGAPSTAKSWKLTGTLPTGLRHNNATNSNTDSVTGVPTQNGSFPVTITAYENSGFSGGSKSASFTISVTGGVSPPTISSQPPSPTINAGNTAALSVTSAGATSFQWYTGIVGDLTNPIAGATAANITTPALNSTTNYWVKVSNTGGSINSNTAVVTVINPPAISTQPASISITSGNTTTLGLTATGTSPNFQWYVGTAGDKANPITTAKSQTFTTPALVATTSYWVQVNNAAGSVNSNTAVVKVADTFTTWAAGRFTLIQLANPLISGPTMDPDADGLTNEQEFIFGTSPLAENRAVPGTLALTNGQFSLSFEALAATGAGYTGLTRRYTVESSPNAGAGPNWSPVSGFSDIPGHGQTVSFTTTAKPGPEFFRVRVSLSPD